MWLTTEPGRATYNANGDTPSVRVVAVGGQAGVRLTIQHDRYAADLQLCDQTGERLPPIAESYARMDNFVACLAQGENDAFGLTMQTRLVQATERCTSVECVIEMQTRLLDSHPSVCLTIADSTVTSRRGSGVLMSIGDQYLAMLQTPRDRAVCQDISDPDGPQRLRVFGDFLEKGVIQKCRFWLIAWGDQPPADPEWDAAEQQLNESPLPLTT